MKPLFNYELFYMNGYPMEFNLYGYTDVHIREIAEIIEAFGGRLSAPGENTIIFSYPGAPNDGICDRLDSKFLFDSVTAGQLQKLDNYRLPSTGVNTAIKAKVCVLVNPETSAAAKPGSTNPEEDIEKFNSTNDLDKLSSSAAPETSAGSSKRVSKSKETKNDLIDTIGSKLEERLRTITHDKKKKRRSKFPSSVDESYAEKGKVKLIKDLILYSKEESTKILKYLDEHKSQGNAIWRKMEAAKIFVKPYRSMNSLRHHYYRKLRGNSKKYLGIEDKLDESQEPIRSVQYKTKQKYSREDDKKIVDYIVKNNLIDYVGGLTVFKRIEADEIFKNPTRTWQNLKNHYNNVLRDRIAEYIDDPDVIKAFEEGRKRRYLKFVERSSKIQVK
ncbi:uncharacterized protein LOC107038896 [Diachasma alloeum]|uniref:uncharacterized protein LOC107038896 n=1 Tax=Diachasma alloeum TaxID=454923 RepID=UPI00073849BE|nr:uncharacterized protein LOC107038896 [Diachasma alloeum]